MSTYAGDGLFEVESKRQLYVVNLRQRTCGCRKWDLIGIPCAHAISMILFDGGKPEDYVHEFYSIYAYNRCYSPIIYPIPSEEQWLKTTADPPIPPRARAQSGRPKKLRKRQVDEPKNPNW